MVSTGRISSECVDCDKSNRHYTGVYLRFTIGGKIRKIAGHIYPQTVYKCRCICPHPRTAGKMTVIGGRFASPSGF